MNKQIDFMVIGAHADDAEIGMGATIAKMCSEGKHGILVDLTSSTAATRGTPKQRIKEAKNAMRVLGGSGLTRINLGLRDAYLKVCDETIFKVIESIRTNKPVIVFTHYCVDYHPDHNTTCEIVKQAVYKSGLASLLPDIPSYRPRRLFHFMGPVYFEPVFCVAVNNFFDIKMNALMEYRSQFHTEDVSKFFGKTDISSPAFLELIETRARSLGTRIRAKYAEGFWCREIAEVVDPTMLQGEPY